MTARTYTSNHVRELRPKKHNYKKSTRNKWHITNNYGDSTTQDPPKIGNRTQLQITNEVASNRIIYASQIENKRAQKN